MVATDLETEVQHIKSLGVHDIRRDNHQGYRQQATRL
jgi:hypothetical protein